MEQLQRAEKQAEALKVHEEITGAKASMEVYKSHDKVHSEEGSISPQLKEDTLESGRQLTEWKIQLKGTCSTCRRKFVQQINKTFKTGGM